MGLTVAGADLQSAPPYLWICNPAKSNTIKNFNG